MLEAHNRNFDVLVFYLYKENKPILLHFPLFLEKKKYMKLWQKEENFSS